MPASGAVRTRIAPTPSGYLHIGNAWSFTLAWLLARSRGGHVHLRIDDLDAARFREEYLADIFASLAWLGLDWDGGPRDPADFHARHSQRLRLPGYRAALDRLAAADALYACACSREQVRRAAEAAGTPGIYPGTCRGLGLPLDAPGTALRLRVPEGEEAALADEVAGMLRLRPEREAGDFVVRQRNGDPAYQLASVADDESLGISLVVRGRDLLPSTGCQLVLAERLGARGFAGARFLHHGLLVEPAGAGAKLSKSSGGAVPGPSSLAAFRARSNGAARVVGFFARLLGQDPEGKSRAADLLPGFDPRRIPAEDLPWTGALAEAP